MCTYLKRRILAVKLLHYKVVVFQPFGCNSKVLLDAMEKHTSNNNNNNNNNKITKTILGYETESMLHFLQFI